MRITSLNPADATDSDKEPFLREFGIIYVVFATLVFGVIYLIALTYSLPAFAIIFVLINVVAYIGGRATGHLFWFLFFEPHVEMRKQKQRAL